ncbi:MAG: glycosyltransferase family 2 protein, partial [Chloroflexota bacterium]
MLGRSRRAVERLRQEPEAQRPAASRRRRRGTPPNVVGKGPLLSAPGLRLGAAVIIRNEAPYLEEWLAYHHALGVQHFFIYDNGSTDELHQAIEAWVNHGVVTLVHWPLPGGQGDAYNHALRFYGPSLDWLAYFDVDEFIVPLIDDDIPSLLARWPDAADVRLPRKDFGFSGHRSPPDELTIEAYTEVADVFGRDSSKPLRVKTIVQPRGISAVGIHTATVADVPISSDGRPLPTETVGNAVHGVAQLNHYYTRSFDEFEAKRFRGSATGRIARPALPFDLPTLETDRSALRFVERTRAEIERMRSLDPSPYHYGSELGLSQFPRYNDLGLFTEFAIANTAAEEPELRREPAMRLENLYAGIGFVADLSATGHEPRVG